MNFEELKRYNPDFDPKSFDFIPHPKAQLFDPAKFPDASSHTEAEQGARELIRDELSKKAGGKPVYSRAELSSYTRGSVRGTEIFENIASGAAIVR